MSNDLISRSTLLEEINNFSMKITGSANSMAITIMEETKKSIAKMIDEQPTVYDVDKVVERLESELSLSDKEKERCVKENPLQFDESKGYARGIAVALEIVKSGGIE